MQIEKISNLTEEKFLNHFSKNGIPFVINDISQSWKMASWTPTTLNKKFGSELVQVYNNYFDLSKIMPLSEYINDFFGKTITGESVPYVRWYTKLKNIDFVWADEAFNSFKSEWSNPYFMPKSNYLLPFCSAGELIDPVANYFPAKGLFISAPGAKTGLHVDPWGSDAILIQIYGEKKWTMFAPSKAPSLCVNNKCVEIDRPDLDVFPDFINVKADYEFLLKPGEAVYVPRGWYHHVDTVSDSISLTWNFVHASQADYFINYLKGNVPEKDMEILRFFFSKWLPQKCSKEEIQSFILKKLGSP